MAKIEHTDKLNSKILNYEKYYDRVSKQKEFANYTLEIFSNDDLWLELR